MGVQRFKLPDSTHTSGGVQLRVIGDGFGNLKVHVVGHVVLQHIQNKAFLDGLPHGIHMEGVVFAALIPLAEHLQRFVLGGSRKGEEGQIFVDTLGS